VTGSGAMIMYTNCSEYACRDSENCIGIGMNIPSSENGLKYENCLRKIERFLG